MTPKQLIENFKKSRVVISGERIYLKIIRSDNATKEYCSWLNDPEVNRYLTTKNITLPSLRSYVEKKYEQDDCLFFGIFLKQNDQHIGNVKLDLMDFKKKKADFGILIGDKSFWGKGVATEATRLIVDLAFNKLKLNILELGVVSGHSAAIKMYEKMGFKVTLVNKGAVGWQGKLFDEIIMILEKDFKTDHTDLLNKLCLGTVQFGLSYGINNQQGKPSRQQSLDMLDFAYAKGIEIFDTANAYGEAEEILGEFMFNRGLNKKIKIVTKIKPNIMEGSSGDVGKIIQTNLEESLKRLKRDYVDGYLLHNPEYIREEKIIGILDDLKKQGLAKNIGVSLYEEADAIYAVKLKEVDYIQVPYSIFDQRLDKTEFFDLAKKNGKTVFTRSMFLQGLLFMSEDKIPPRLAGVKIYFKELDRILKKYGLSRLQAALMFSLDNHNINYVVFGVDNIDQLADIIGLTAKSVNYQACIQELKNKFANTEKSLISPSLWKK